MSRLSDARKKYEGQFQRLTPNYTKRDVSNYTSYTMPDKRTSCDPYEKERLTYTINDPGYRDSIIKERVDLSLAASDVYSANETSLLTFHLDCYRRLKPNDRQTTVGLISGGLKIPTRLFTIPYPSTIQLYFTKPDNEYLTNCKVSENYHFIFHADFTKSNLTNPNLDSYIYYEPEFPFLDLLGPINLDVLEMHLLINGCNHVFPTPRICPELVAEGPPKQFFYLNHRMLTGDVIRSCGKCYTVTVLDDNNFTANVPNSECYNFVITNLDFNYNIILLINKRKELY